MRGFIRSVWLLNPTTPSAGAGAAAQLPTQFLSLGKTALHPSALWSDPAAAVASTAMDFEAFMARDRQFASERRRQGRTRNSPGGKAVSKGLIGIPN